MRILILREYDAIRHPASYATFTFFHMKLYTFMSYSYLEFLIQGIPNTSISCLLTGGGGDIKKIICLSHSSSYGTR
jgi:hypothetical protein